MLSKPPERRQGDGLQEEYSDLTAFDFSKPDPVNEHPSRQEWKQEADINFLLDRFGFNLASRNPVFGEFDQDLTLQMAHDSIGASRAAWARLPDDLKKKYPHWTNLLYAISSGEVKSIDLKPKPERTDETAPNPSTPSNGG